MNVYLVILIFWSLGNVELKLVDRLWSWVDNNTQPTSHKETHGLTEGMEANISCESSKLYHQWYQWGDKYRLIGALPLQKGVKKTVFIMNVEKFDDNTEIFCMRGVNDSLSDIRLQATFRINGNCYRRITVFNNTLSELKIEEPAVLRYSETKNVQFSCEEYVNKSQYIYIGLHMTSNVINTFNATFTNKNFNIKYNGTVLCCIYYVVTDFCKSVTCCQEKRIYRYVVKKTLLLYHDAAYQQDNLEGFTDASGKTYILYATSAVAVAIILIVIFITIRVYKNRYTAKANTDTRVLYVDLDLLRQAEDFHRPESQEESPYAEIIGEIRPPNKVNE